MIKLEYSVLYIIIIYIGYSMAIGQYAVNYIR